MASPATQSLDYSRLMKDTLLLHFLVLEFTDNYLVSKLLCLSLGPILLNQELQQKLRTAFLHPNQTSPAKYKILNWGSFCSSLLIVKTVLFLPSLVGKLQPIYYELNLVTNSRRMLFFLLNMFLWQVYGMGLGLLYFYLIIIQVFASRAAASWRPTFSVSPNFSNAEISPLFVD